MPSNEKSLEQRVQEKADRKTEWDTDQKDWVYVTIPEEDSIGRPHPTVWINHHQFEAGKTYLVPQIAAQTVNERLKAHRNISIRIYQPTRDPDTSRIQAGGGVYQVTNDPTKF